MLLKIALPKGSLQLKTIELLNNAGYNIRIEDRKYICICADTDIEFSLCKASEIPLLVARNIVQCGLCGYDMLIENNMINYFNTNINMNQYSVKILQHITYSKKTFSDAMYVIAVDINSDINSVHDLEGKTIATEKCNILNAYLMHKGITCNVIHSSGATESKISQGLCDAICDITETGETLRKQNLRIISKVLNTNTVAICNEQLDSVYINKFNDVLCNMCASIHSRNKSLVKIIHQGNIANIIDTIKFTSLEKYGTMLLSGEVIVDNTDIHKLCPLLVRHGFICVTVDIHTVYGV